MRIHIERSACVVNGRLRQAGEAVVDREVKRARGSIAAARRRVCRIWGRHFPEFATRETRLHEVNDVRAALEATGAFRSVRTQTVAWPVTTSLIRLVEQVIHYHYSTFRLYSEDALRAAIDTFRQRVRQAFRDVTHITYDNDHMLVMAQRLVSRG